MYTCFGVWIDQLCFKNLSSQRKREIWQSTCSWSQVGAAGGLNISLHYAHLSKQDLRILWQSIAQSTQSTLGKWQRQHGSCQTFPGRNTTWGPQNTVPVAEGQTTQTLPTWAPARHGLYPEHLLAKIFSPFVRHRKLLRRVLILYFI